MGFIKSGALPQREMGSKKSRGNAEKKNGKEERRRRGEKKKWKGEGGGKRGKRGEREGGVGGEGEMKGGRELSVVSGTFCSPELMTDCRLGNEGKEDGVWPAIPLLGSPEFI